MHNRHPEWRTPPHKPAQATPGQSCPIVNRVAIPVLPVVVSKLDQSTVRVTSDDRRLDTVDVSLTRSGNRTLNTDGDTPFIVDWDRNSPSLLFNPIVR